MKNRRLVSCLLVLLLCVHLFAGCAQAESRGILYRVVGGKNEMTILGSIHIGNQDMYPFSETIQNAIERADVFVYECDTESAEALQATMALMSYPVGEGIASHLSSNTYDLLCDAAQKSGYPISLLQGFKPWAVVSLLSMDTAAVEMGTDDVLEALELGVEKQVMLMAEGRETAYLETTREQLEMMDSFSAELQEYMVSSACELILHPESLSAGDASVRYWPEWWAAGNAEAFAQSYLQENVEDPHPELMQEYHEKLNAQRNVRMARRIAELLETGHGQRFFVTVGLLHLVLPDDSIVAELEKMGYTVERIF